MPIRRETLSGFPPYNAPSRSRRSLFHGRPPVNPPSVPSFGRIRWHGINSGRGLAPQARPTAREPPGRPIFFATAPYSIVVPRGIASRARHTRKVKGVDSGHANGGGSHFFPRRTSRANRSAFFSTWPSAAVAALISDPIHLKDLRGSANSEGNRHDRIFPSFATTRMVPHELFMSRWEISLSEGFGLLI